MQKITPHFWFDTQAEEAATFYASVFNGGKVGSTSRYTEAGHDVHGMEAGTALTVEFEIEGMKFVALNGGPHFTPNPSISFFVRRDTKEEINALWEELSDGGTALMPLDTYPFSERYGWIQDRYGISWQLILPKEEGDERPPIMPSFLFVGENCGKAEEASDLYLSVFKHTKRGIVARYPEGMEPDKEGTIQFTDFMLENQWFAAMDSAHEHAFAFNEAISFMVDCETQEEIDYYWEKLAADPSSGQCGWLKDVYGVSWQIVPSELGQLMSDPDKEKSDRVMKAMLKMKKLDIAELKRVAGHE